MGVKIVKILELISYVVILSVLDQLETILHYLLVVVDDKDVRVGRRKRWRNRCKIYDEARAYAGWWSVLGAKWREVVGLGSETQIWIEIGGAIHRIPWAVLREYCSEFNQVRQPVEADLAKLVTFFVIRAGSCPVDKNELTGVLLWEEVL